MTVGVVLDGYTMLEILSAGKKLFTLYIVKRKWLEFYATWADSDVYIQEKTCNKLGEFASYIDGVLRGRRLFAGYQIFSTRVRAHVSVFQQHTVGITDADCCIIHSVKVIKVNCKNI